MNFIELTEEEFDNRFTPVENHLSNNASFNGWMFETYGEELEYVMSMIETRRVWTIITGENDTLFYSSGFHIVNRLGYLITEEVIDEDDEDTEINVQLDTDF